MSENNGHGDVIRIPIDLITHTLVGADGKPRVIVAGKTYELFASGELLRQVNHAKTRNQKSRRIQPEQPAKGLR